MQYLRPACLQPRPTGYGALDTVASRHMPAEGTHNMQRPDLHPEPVTETVTIGQAIDIPDGTLGYVTASSEGYALRRLRPLRTAGKPMGTIRENNSRLMDNGRTNRITRLEAARFQSFPDGFAWAERWRACCGNAVPPLMMRSIASHIRGKILERLS